MIMKALTIRMVEYGSDKECYNGFIKVAGEHGEIDLKLNQQQAEAIVALCAGFLVDAAKEVLDECDDVFTHSYYYQPYGGQQELAPIYKVTWNV